MTLQFDWTDFLAPLTPAAILMSFTLGVVLGGIIYDRRAFILTHVYWMFAAGVIFFIPLSIERGLEGLHPWEHFLADLLLWDVYIVGTMIFPLLQRRYRKR